MARGETRNWMDGKCLLKYDPFIVLITELLFYYFTERKLSFFSVTQQASIGSHIGGVSSQMEPGAGWPAALSPLHSQSANLGHTPPHAGTTRGSAVSALLTHGEPHLLIPKTEKLSPVQLHSTDRSSLNGTPSRPQFCC